MPDEEEKPSKVQVCTLNIAFPVDSDDKAIEIKKKVSAVIADLPKVMVDFNIRDVELPPKRPP